MISPPGAHAHTDSPQLSSIPPRRTAGRPRVVEVVAGYVVLHTAAVTAKPIRPKHEARELAERIADNPAEALGLLVGLGVDGVFDLRPIFGKVVE